MKPRAHSIQRAGVVVAGLALAATTLVAPAQAAAPAGGSHGSHHGGGPGGHHGGGHGNGHGGHPGGGHHGGGHGSGHHRPGTSTIQLLGINDFHGRIEAGGTSAGAAVVAGAVKELSGKKKHNTLFVSAGDNIGASTFTSFSQDDTPTIDALRTAGLDVSSVGNHEFDRGIDDLKNRVIPRYGKHNRSAGADYALGANVYHEGTHQPALKEYALRKVQGVTVGFIGVVTEQTKSLVTPSGVAGLDFGNQLEAVNRVSTQLSDGKKSNGEADVIVLLAHEGSASTDCSAIADEDTAYGELVRGASADVDAIFSGHTHQEYACSFPVEGWSSSMKRPVVQAHEYGTTLDRVKITVDRRSKKPVALSGSLVELTKTNHAGETVPAFPADRRVARVVKKAAEQAEIVGAEQVGRISADILRGGNEPGADRGVESSMGNLVADMQLWATSNEDFGGEPAQIALMNPGGLRADLLYGTNGTVTYKDVANVQPFGNTLWTEDLTGAQLKTVLEEQWQPDGSSRPKLHLGISEGLDYTYTEDAARGSHITSMTFDGAAIADDDVFKVVMNSFLAAGGDNFTTLAEGANATDSGQSDLVAALDYFEAHDVVDPAPLGRAVAQ
ncbi:MAG: bifunctional metallophosphatase/5'-nucleotidase [Micrococcaceae bacterium]|nr:bifunctional metallophosphatase/5'-nucleotidase [Micrococcaceae bacterium]